MRTSTESLPTTKTLSLVGNAVLTPVCDIEPLDRSVSQPNICGEVTLSVIVPASPTVLASCSSTSSDLSRGGYASADSLGSLSSKDELAAPSPIIEKDVKLPADTVADRNAVQSAGLTADEDLTDRCMSLSTSLEPTPDLVLNLPTASSVPITVRPLSPPLTTAEVFASAEHGTIKKNSGVDRNPNACGDSINCAFDEVFPTTPQEINDALDADSFSFDLLPPPPPRLLDHDDQELSLSVPVSHECEDQEPRDLMTANVTVDVDVVVVDDTAAAVVSSVAREELEHFENNDVVPAGSENSSSNSEQIDVIPVDANNDAESARLIHNDLELTVHVSSNDVALGIDMSASPVGSQSSALDAVVNAPVSPDRISASVAVSHTDEVLECPADHYTVNTEGGKTSNEMQYSIDSTSQQQVPDAASSQTIDAASFESRRSPQPPDDANVKMEPHVELVPCTEPSSSIGAESCSSQTACDSDLQAEKNVPLPVIPQVVPTSDCTTAVSQLVLNTHKLTHSVLAEHRAPPSLQAHSAVLDMLTKQHENSEELMKQPSSDKPKSKPPPVMKKPAKPAQSHDVTRQQ